MLSKALLYLRTVRRMRPGMVFSRLRGQRRLPERTFTGEHPASMPRIAIPELDLDPHYLARFDAEALLNGDFLLINERRRVDLDTWNAPEASHLWNFNLHYFEWGGALAARWRETGEERYLGRYKELVCSWIAACPYPEGDAWHPYTISLRLVNWLIAADLFDGALEKDGEFFSAMRESMYRQYRHLLSNQETHLRANHWWENLKTLAIASAAFGEWDAHTKVMRRLEGQLGEQVLPDGVHFERSLMYHKLVLEGLLRVWLASEQFSFEFPDNFMTKAKSMLDAMASLERGMGKTPLFNDSADGVAKECGPLTEACFRLLGMEADSSITAFPDAGYYKLYDGDVAVMLDAGEPGPSYMLGHAHCDCLSFELSYGGEPVIVNSGTYAYQSELRPYFRSTAAHNTCTIDGEEQLECWSEHRVGWGYHLIGVRASGKSAEAAVELTSGRVHRRRVRIDSGGLAVSDGTDGRASLESYVHVLRPDLATVLAGEGCGYAEQDAEWSCRFSVLGNVRSSVVSGEGTVEYTIRLKGGASR